MAGGLVRFGIGKLMTIDDGLESRQLFRQLSEN